MAQDKSNRRDYRENERERTDYRPVAKKAPRLPKGFRAHGMFPKGMFSTHPPKRSRAA